MTSLPEFLDLDSLRKYIDERLVSRDWWFILNGREVLGIIESRYYTPGTPKSEGFEIVMTPYGLTIAMALRSEMTPEQLAGCLVEAGADVSQEELARLYERSDIILPSYDDQEAASAIRIFQEIVGRE